MAVHDIHHVSLQYDDLESTIRFYSGMLGLEVRNEGRPASPGAWLAAGDGQRINLSPRGTEPAHFAMIVDDIEELVPRLLAAGYEVLEKNAPLMNVSVRDPAGNWVELRRPPGDWVDWAGRGSR